jgi:branched-chain amino acid transport system substrate-binding protein
MPEQNSVNRREFLKLVGIAGAGLTVSGGLGGLVAACGGTTAEETTSTTAGATTTSTAAATTTTAGATTTVSAAAETGREIKVGCVVPKTGPLSTFVIPFDWCNEQWAKATADGVVLGDGKNHAIKTYVEDTQSDTNRCAQVTGDLIQNQKVDVIFAAGAPDTMMPAADQCEALQCPGLCIQGPWEAFYFGRGGTPDKNPFKWALGLCVGVSAMANSQVDVWNQIQTNKKAGLLYSNDANGQAWGSETQGGPFFFKKGGYAYVLPSFYQPGTEDYTQQISAFKKFGAEIFAGVANSADFTNFWKQSLQQGFKPIVCTPAMALTFVETVEAIGDTANGMTVECNWHPSYPYTSPLTKKTCQETADAYETDTGHMWSTDLMIMALMEWYVEAMKTNATLDDKEATLNAISTVKVETTYGPIDFTMPVDATLEADVTHPVPNALRMPLGAAQWWIAQDNKWGWKRALVSNKYCSTAKTEGKPKEMSYT